jgi:hypothetical protein
MARYRQESRAQRQHRFEQFEQRLVMSAQAVGSLLPELDIASPALTQQVVTHPLLGNASATTQAAEVAEQYGFDGAGQTVAVIDSGIAWDHYALGGGFGEGNQVVGGWDFAENDANPYDDGPAGFHGTHVAGIIGSTDDQYRGVSSGVDLVGLRVFDDSGAGNLEWVEQALQWVHDHKDDFANPITTVNLSLGTDWNAFDVPEWASLEDEFAQLETDGLFISVAAGNSFLSYGTTGLSYPAVSSHVVPVASHGTDGKISDFSQRAEDVLVAPGEAIKSTVPDHLFGGTSNGQFLGSTGTSMAAPYVAGASAVLRQANEFMGVTGIDQEMLYQQFRETADQIYDQVTGGYYYRINLEAALNSVVADHHANNATAATDLGTMQNGGTIQGTIGMLTDVDYFSFRAESDGVIHLNVNATHDLSPEIAISGSVATHNGTEISFAVEAGQEYIFSIGTAGGNGHYDIAVDYVSGSNSTQTPATDWGLIVSSQFTNQNISGESNYQMQANLDGFLTIRTSAQNGPLNLEVYDSQMNLVASRSGDGSSMRLDIIAQEGETYFLNVTGNATGVNFLVDNLVSLNGDQLTVHGTNQNDSIQLNTSNGFSIDVNGVGYAFSQSAVQNIYLIGHGGQDSIDLQLGSQDDHVATRPGGVIVDNSDFIVNAGQFESVQVDGGGGYDTVSLRGSAGNDTFWGSAAVSTLSGAGYSSRVSGFDIVYSQSTGGYDTVEFQGSSGNDLFVSNDQKTMLHSGGTIVVADHFDFAQAFGGGGQDSAILFDSAGNDQFRLAPELAEIINDQFTVSASGFETVNAIGGHGDTMLMQDSQLDDSLWVNDGIAVMTGNGFKNVARGFDQIDAVASSGNDVALIFDSQGDDVFISQGHYTEMQFAIGSVTTNGFDWVTAIARNGGQDQAFIQGTNGSDIVNADDTGLTLRTSDELVRRTVDFEQTDVDTLGGIDYGFLTGSEGNDRLTGSADEVEMETTLQMLRLINAEHTKFDGNGGVDEVFFEEFETLDLLSSIGDQATAFLRDHTVTVEDFDILEATTVDNAMAEYDLEAIDYLYTLHGNWTQR